jgi:gluconate kinase
VPTYKRLLAAGAKNVQFSFFDDVHDRTGLYQKEDGTPFEYNGHWSWIYVYNNECASTIDGSRVTLMEWLAAQHR